MTDYPHPRDWEERDVTLPSGTVARAKVGPPMRFPDDRRRPEGENTVAMEDIAPDRPLEYQDTPADPKAYLPYAGTSGWSGSETSRERVEREDSEGITAERQRQAMASVRWAGARGITVRELAARQGLHHGQASSTLSVLHLAGRLVRLTERRDRCQIYVTPDNVHGRAEAPRKPNKASAALDQVRAQARRWVERGHVDPPPGATCRHCAGQDILNTIEGTNG